MRFSILTTLMLGTIALCGGCARTMAEDSAADHWSIPEQELDFLDDLESRHVVTNSDALHGLLLFASPGESFESYEACVREAQQRGWVSDFDAPADESARVGTIAASLCRILGIEGGLTMRVFGNVPRYATRELIFLGLLPDRSAGQSMSGLEFVDLLRKAESWRRQTPEFILQNIAAEEPDAGDEASIESDAPSEATSAQGENQG